ncbi:hypothetical protein BAUCODRAFT_75640 [Baudoinia panamericana UAMH 10762]|uniref:Zn(2)-C6 fungal-type domain-containing protein n=1 Tax=Baudoinia panamericana (strain UAMH 10762) TaxID=717646 RepID=M2MPF6_BAUPA|nr:uncharacterized protein BAUCODRAFT_75640 [Baudoinia panamericana UAMH 10762]EMC93348.1 hypothetical protein BAUCODRAFT_75640 [Baudoinia panamericana UAMH 10762]
MHHHASAQASPGAAFREYGEKPPEITRKITACVACRKQKIKCNMGDGPPCVRCKKRGLSCTVNKSLQMILESDADWKTKTESRVKALESALNKVADRLSMPELLEYEMEDDEEDDAKPPRSHPSSRLSPLAEKHTPHNFEIVMDDNAGPAAIPGSVMTPVIVPGVEPNREDQDIIKRGVLTVEQAQAYLDLYQNRLDHFLYRILGDRRSLGQVRKTSPLLLAGICTVSALHLAARDFERLYQEFVSIAAAQTFSRHNNVDDVRGLLVGAFWLSGISWTCVGAAVRMATEIQLQRSIFKTLSGDRSHYLRTRLYYLVYICDHHFSIAYGRPPMTRQDDTIRASSAFLDSEHAVEDDARLVSQVKFWSVGTEVYETFGIDVERPLTADMIDPIRRFGIKLDEIRAYWSERLTRNDYVGNYPRKGVHLHYHFAKLYLYSMAFRGIGKPGFKAPDVALDIDELANNAILSATTILRTVIQDPEIQGHLNGLPTYFDLMIAFATVFVLKVSTKYATSVRVDTTEIRSLVGEVVRVLKHVTSTMHPRHLLVSVARGAGNLLERCRPQDYRGPYPSNAHVTLSHPTFDDSLYDVSRNGQGPMFDNFFMGEFDFLSTQDMMNNFQQDPQFPQLPPQM